MLRAGAALVITMPARVIHENVTHHLSNDGEEVRAILSIDILLIDKL